MCTAISYSAKRHYFGRNLDLEYAYPEQVVVTPRNYAFHFRNGTSLPHHYAMIGMATVSYDYPLYYEATNEMGLSIASLNFPGNAAYFSQTPDRDNVAPFELIPWILGQCATVPEAQNLLTRINLWKINFSDELPLSPLHWIIADKYESIVAESMADGLHIYDNPIGVLTNNPPFPYHLQHLADHQQLSPGERRLEQYPSNIAAYSSGMGATGLPGDFSSTSRFVRAAFVKEHSRDDGDEISQFFHILSAVAMPRGSVMVHGKPEITRYSSCCDTAAGIYYYTTYHNSRITAIKMHSCPLDSEQIIPFELRQEVDIRFEN